MLSQIKADLGAIYVRCTRSWVIIENEKLTKYSNLVDQHLALIKTTTTSNKIQDVCKDSVTHLPYFTWRIEHEKIVCVSMLRTWAIISKHVLGESNLITQQKGRNDQSSVLRKINLHQRKLRQVYRLVG